MLWLCLHFPELPLELFARAGRAGPFALTVGKAARRAVFRASPEAVAAGVRPGMPVSAALALVPDLALRPRDEVAEAAALENLAAWAGQFTSLVSLSEAPFPALLLEIEGSLLLFGGRESLLASILGGVEELGYRVLSAAAPTPLGAELLARAGVEGWRMTLPELCKSLDPLPVRALGLSPEAGGTLEGLGVRTIGECRRLPPQGVRRRFGPQLGDLLARAFGQVPDLRKTFVPPPRFEARLELSTEVLDADALLFGARRLLLELEGFLAARGSGAEAFCLRLFGPDRSALDVQVELASPGRDPARLLGLLRERLGRIALPGPVSALGLSAARLGPLPIQSVDFFRPHGPEKGGEGALLLERLRARLGRGALQGIRLVADYRPERSFACESFPQPPPSEDGSAPSPPRPLWLLPEPRPVAREGLTLLSGPERIETGWWDGAIARDYYVAEDREGARLWVFRSTEYRVPGTGYGEPGIGDRGPAAGSGARWFLHGLFG